MFIGSCITACSRMNIWSSGEAEAGVSGQPRLYSEALSQKNITKQNKVNNSLAHAKSILKLHLTPASSAQSNLMHRSVCIYVYELVEAFLGCLFILLIFLR